MFKYTRLKLRKYSKLENCYGLVNTPIRPCKMEEDSVTPILDIRN